VRPGVPIERARCGDTPLSEELFRAPRDINRSLPPTRPLRVVLAEPPIDWDSVGTMADVLKYGDVADIARLKKQCGK
jgi:hypothetical protein